MASQPTAPRAVTGWVGWVWFSGIMLVTVGLLAVFQGLIAVFDDDFTAAFDGQLLILNLTTWGWVHVAVGALFVVAGTGVVTGALWGRILGVLIAAANLVVQLTILPVYPIWALIVTVLDAVVIYALVVHGAETTTI